MLAVVSPAKKLDTDTVGRSLAYTQPSLMTDIKELMTTTQTLQPSELQSLMGISEKLAALNHERFQNFQTPFTEQNAKAAALMFNGDTYMGLDANSLSDESLTWAQDHLAILSGLYGILKPLDLIQPYRLEMGTKLQTERGRSLYAFWDDKITRQINAQLAHHKDKTLINLASNEYFNSVKRAQLPGPVLTPAFKEMRDGKPKMISFLAKKARGMMARFIIDNRIETPEELKAFNMGGYAYDSASSDDTTWTFIR